MNFLKNRMISVVMNKETEWTIEPWHVRASFRKAGVHILSDSCIELPPKPIKGPDMDLELKDFFVTVTINEKHKVRVRCRIHHWSTSINDRLPWLEKYWEKPIDFVFPEEKPADTSEQTKST